MKIFKYLSIMVLFPILLSSCNTYTNQCEEYYDLIPLFMINDITYYPVYNAPNEEAASLNLTKGKKVGTIKFTWADSKCIDRETKNGDATYLKEGTEIYEIKGYPSSLIVLAKNRVYVAVENKKAMYSRELNPINGFVKEIHIEYDMKKSPTSPFSPASVNKFLKAWDQMELENDKAVSKKGSFTGVSYIIKLELKNGITISRVYWQQSNIFSHNGVGNTAMKEVMDYEISILKKKHPM